MKETTKEIGKQLLEIFRLIVFSSLKNMIDGFKLLTTNMGLIHIVISTDLNAENIQRIATENNSDHDGINCSIKFA